MFILVLGKKRENERKRSVHTYVVSALKTNKKLSLITEGWREIFSRSDSLNLKKEKQQT